jgi:hypothetical protein
MSAEHLKEEEITIPTLVRANYTHEEEGPIIEQIIQSEGLDGARLFIPSALVAMEEWAKQEFIDKEFRAKMPGPILHLVDNYFLPDYKNYVIPMRDAPTLKNEPMPKRVPCCRIPFCCFPCIV